MPNEVTIRFDEGELVLTEENTTVYRFREASHIDHVYVADGHMIFSVEPLIRLLIDNDFPLCTARWPRACDFSGYDKYIEQQLDDLNQEMGGL